MEERDESSRKEDVRRTIFDRTTSRTSRRRSSSARRTGRAAAAAAAAVVDTNLVEASPENDTFRDAVDLFATAAPPLPPPLPTPAPDLTTWRRSLSSRNLFVSICRSSRNACAALDSLSVSSISDRRASHRLRCRSSASCLRRVVSSSARVWERCSSARRVRRWEAFVVASRIFL